MTPTPEALAKIRVMLESCSCVRPPCDGWLQQRKCWDLDNAIGALLTEQARAIAKDTLSELSAVECEDERVAYVTVQVSRAWREDLRARAQEETPSTWLPWLPDGLALATRAIPTADSIRKRIAAQGPMDQPDMTIGAPTPTPEALAYERRAVAAETRCVDLQRQLTEQAKASALEEAAKHADCCVDRETLAEQAREMKKWRDEADEYHQKLCVEIERTKGQARESEAMRVVNAALSERVKLCEREIAQLKTKYHDAMDILSAL
jgi:hypothetical protein